MELFHLHRLFLFAKFYSDENLCKYVSMHVHLLRSKQNLLTTAPPLTQLKRKVEQNPFYLFYSYLREIIYPVSYFNFTFLKFVFWSIHKIKNNNCFANAVQTIVFLQLILIVLGFYTSIKLFKILVVLTCYLINENAFIK